MRVSPSRRPPCDYRSRPTSPMRDRIDLFIASVLVLFLELACIRWFPAHVLFLTFFTNTVLLACVPRHVGRLPGGRAAGGTTSPGRPLLLRRWRSAPRTWSSGNGSGPGSVVDVGNQSSPQLVFFGVEYAAAGSVEVRRPDRGGVRRALRPHRAGAGRARASSSAVRSRGYPNRVEAYTVNIGGSLAGILLFTACSWWQLGPVWWFGGAPGWRSPIFRGAPSVCRWRSSRLTSAAILLLAVRRRVAGQAAVRHEARVLVAVLSHRLRPERAAHHHREPDRPPADELARRSVPRVRAAAPAQPRRRAAAVRARCSSSAPAPATTSAARCSGAPRASMPSRSIR